MTFKKISSVLLLLLPFVAAADTFSWTQHQFLNQTTDTATAFSVQGITLDEAQKRAAQFIGFMVNSSDYSFSYSSAKNYAAVSNTTTGAYYNHTSNPYRKQNTTFFTQVFTWCRLYDYPVTNLWDKIIFSSGKYYFQEFDADLFVRTVYDRLSVSQLLQLSDISSKLTTLQSDVSDLIPLVESNKNINAGLALDFKSAITNAQYQRSEIINDLSQIINNRLFTYTVDYDIPQIRDDIRAMIRVNPDVAYDDNNALAIEYFDLLGFDYSQDQGALIQAMINAGLATSNNDALGKLSSVTWRRNTLGPYVQAQRKKRDLIAQLRQSGITHNFDGRALDALANPELETLLQFSFNTPVSSNATLKAESLRKLDNIDYQTADAASSLGDIRQTLNGPLDVNVLNWPDDWLANSVSNAFNGVFDGLLEGVTNFNPHYNFDDEVFFGRNLYNWRGFGLSSLDQSNQNPVQADDVIGVTTFEFSPTGDYFQDVPNLLAMQAMQGADLANIFASVAIHIQSNAVESANTDAEMEQYKEDLTEMANSALSEFQGLLHYSNLLQNVEFTDTKDLLSLPEGFRTFEGEWEIPEYVNIQMPSWEFTDPSEPQRRGAEDPQQAYTLTIDTAQYRQLFQNVRYVALTLYWGIGVLVILFLFRLFKAFVSWIPAGLTGEVPHDHKL